MSIDAPGANMFNSGNHPDNFNYIDTYVEFVTEVVLQYENLIPENKNRQHKELQQHKQFQVIYSTVEISVAFAINNTYAASVDFNYNDKFAYQFIKEITPPPPRFC